MNSEEITADNIGEILFQFLREMDEEADRKSYYKNILYHTGLREYYFHVHPNRDPNKSITHVPYEDAWTERLKELFLQNGITAKSFPSYPDSSRKGDLLLTLSDFSSLFIEIKGAWTYNLHPRIYKSKVYYKHLTSSTEGTAKDFIKIQDAHADHKGILLVGFDAPEHEIYIEDAHIAEMKVNASYDETEWKEHYEEWEDHHFPGARVRCWFWLNHDN